MYQESSFPLPPPIKGEWIDLDPEAAALLVARLSETGYFTTDDSPGEMVRVMPLSFYPGWLLCDIPTRKRKHRKEQGDSEPPQGRGVHSFLFGPDGFTALNGNSDPIHAHNAHHGIDLRSAREVEDYVHFFCFFVRGDEGPFEIAGDDQQLFLAPDENGVKHTAEIEPLTVVACADSGEATAKATIYYGGRLHEVCFSVSQTGQVRMGDDDVIAMGVTRVPALAFSNTLRFEVGGTSNGN